MASPRCPTCGTVMCEDFDERRINSIAVLATPNGKFWCYTCANRDKWCPRCPHPKHLGLCDGRNGQTANPCPCIRSTP